jgi:hypothetical protein
VGYPPCEHINTRNLSHQAHGTTPTQHAPTETQLSVLDANCLCTVQVLGEEGQGAESTLAEHKSLHSIA